MSSCKQRRGDYGFPHDPDRRHNKHQYQQSAACLLFSLDWVFILTQSKTEILVLVKGNCQMGFQIDQTTNKDFGFGMC